MKVTTDSVALGNYLAVQHSDAQADVLWGFAAQLYEAAFNWRLQVAYIREAWNDSQRPIIEEVLRELLAASPSTEGDGSGE